MTDYLHEKTALLPKIRLQEPSASIGKSTVQAMQIGAIHGYRGLIRSIVDGVKKSLKTRQLNVITTGGCGNLIATEIPEVTYIRPRLTLEGLRIAAHDIK